MKIAIMQPYLFPYIGYFQLINAVDKFVIFDDVNYINKGWINRNRILLNKQEYTFTIPLEKVSQNKLINEVNIVNEIKWKAKFLKTIETAYKKAPMFHQIFPLIEEVINFEERNLSAYICHSIRKLCSTFGIKAQIIESTVQYNTCKLKGQDKILEICLQEKATQYINPIGGTEIYQHDSFEQKQLELLFLKSKSIVYTQFGNDFIPWLSIIDVLMFNSKEKISDFLTEYKLV
jgi:hypothetical protein